MDSSLPNKLSEYNIKLLKQSEKIVCELEYNGQIFQSNISTLDLKSGFISLIKSNIQQTQPNYTIWLEYVLDKITNVNNLILNIKYSSEYFEFNENIYFKEKNLMEEEINIDYKSLLLFTFLNLGWGDVKYELMETNINNNDVDDDYDVGKKYFKMCVKNNIGNIIGVGIGSSKYKSQYIAAKKALEYLNIISSNNKDDIISEEIYHKDKK